MTRLSLQVSSEVVLNVDDHRKFLRNRSYFPSYSEHFGDPSWKHCQCRVLFRQSDDSEFRSYLNLGNLEETNWNRKCSKLDERQLVCM